MLLRPCRAGDPAETAALAALDAPLAGTLGDSGPSWHAGTAAAPDRVHLVLDRGVPDRGPDPAWAPAGYLVLAAPRGPEPGVELHRIVVAADRRDTGIGRALLRTALLLAGTATGHDGTLPLDPGWDPPGWLATGRLWLEVDPANTAALALYRSAGLVTETRLPSVPGDPDSSVRRLVLAIG